MQLSPLLVKMDGLSLCEQVFAKYNHTFIHTSPTQQEKNPSNAQQHIFPKYPASCNFLRLNNLHSQ